MEPAAWLAFLERIADRTDAIALRLFRSANLSVEHKDDASPVTEADRGIERLAREMAERDHPELAVYGEELGRSEGSTRLIIDPIDATRNFVRGIPIFASLLAIEIDAEIVAGLVSAPALSTRWRAARGFGAWQGDRPIHVSGISELSAAQLFHGSLAGDEQPAGPGAVARLAAATARQRGFGDFYQHCLVACGSGEIAIDFGLRPWDIAPLQVLIEEAGGRLTDPQGRRTIHASDYVASNGLLHQTVLERLNG